MKFGMLVALLVLLVPVLVAMSCTYDSSPNMWSDFRFSCMTNQSNTPRCYAYSETTSGHIVVGEYPKGTFDFDREKFIVPDTSGGFVLVVPLGGEYIASDNYTMNITCFNTSAYDSANYTFVTSLARPPDWIGEIAQWGVSNARYIAFGGLLLFIVVGGAYFIFRMR